jgi:polyvinyl alcohol dehydrogenase (cytochrome)
MIRKIYRGINILRIAIGISILTIFLLGVNVQKINADQPSGGEWTQLINDYKDSRYQPTSIGNVSILTKAWIFHTNGSVTSTPIVKNGSVYFDDSGGNIYSVNVTTGSLNWKIHRSAYYSSTLAWANNVIYIAGRNSSIGQAEVIAVSATNGKLIWRTLLNSAMKYLYSSPIIYNGLLYIGTSSSGGADCNFETNASCKGQLFALHTKNGTVDWSFLTAGTSGGAGIWGSTVVDTDNNQIFFGTGNTYNKSGTPGYAYSIISLNASTGSLNWYYQTYNSTKNGKDYDFGSTPNLISVYNNGAFHKAVGLGSKDGNYYIWDRNNGTLLGKFRIVPASSGGGIIGIPGFLYGLIPNSSTVIIFTPAINGISTSGCCGVLSALRPGFGSIAWNFTTPGAIVGSTAEVSGAVLFGDNKGNLYVVDAKTGKKLFNTTLPSGIYSGVTPAEGHVFASVAFNSTGNGVYAFLAG